MRVVPILTATLLVFGLTACGAGGGGGPSDLNLGGPTSAPVTTTSAPTTSTPAVGSSLAARARFAQLAVYGSPNAAVPERVLPNPWTPKESPRERVPQVLLVDHRQPDGWVQVLLPDTPQATEGWVRAFDVKVSTVTYRVRVVLSRHRIAVFDNDRQVFQSPISVADAQQAGVQPGPFYLRWAEPARTMAMTGSPYAYRFIASLVTRVPLGTPVDIVG